MSARFKPVIKQAVSLAIWMAIVVTGSAFANDIYKWTDAEGNVHYGDRPAEDAETERLNIDSRPTDPAQVAALAKVNSNLRRQQPLAPAGEESNEPTPEELRAIAEERAEKCTMYKERLQTFVQSRRLYRQDENGERVYLSEEETQATREETQSKVEEYCER